MDSPTQQTFEEVLNAGAYKLMILERYAGDQSDKIRSIIVGIKNAHEAQCRRREGSLRKALGLLMDKTFDTPREVHVPAEIRRSIEQAAVREALGKLTASIEVTADKPISKGQTFHVAGVPLMDIYSALAALDKPQEAT